MKVFKHTTWDFEEYSFCPTLTNVAAYTKPKGFCLTKQTCLMGNDFDSMNSGDNACLKQLNLHNFFEHSTFFDQNSPRPFLSSAQNRVVFGYTLRVSEASTAKVSSRGGGGAAGCSLLGLEAQVTERKPKITRSAATSVHHVLRFVDAFKGVFSPSFRRMDRRKLLWWKISGRVMFLMCTFWNNEWGCESNLLQYWKAL